MRAADFFFARAAKAEQRLAGLLEEARRGTHAPTDGTDAVRPELHLEIQVALSDLKHDLDASASLSKEGHDADMQVIRNLVG